MRRSKQHGLSLVEILVVVAILGILIALLLGVIGKFQGRAKTVGCAQQLRQIGLAIQNYAIDNADFMVRDVDISGFPSWMADLLPYLSTRDTYLCPSDFNAFTVTYCSPTDPRSLQGTFTNTFVEDATITFRRLMGAYGGPRGWANPDGGHNVVLRLSIPTLGYSATVTSNHQNWSTTTIWTSPVFGRFNPTDITIEVGAGNLSGGPYGGYTHSYRNVREWYASAYNPYQKAYTGFFTVWGVVKDPTTIIYAYYCGTSENWFWGDTYTDADQWLRARAAPGSTYGPNDFGFEVSVNAPNSSGPLVGRIGDLSFTASYAYNSQVASKKRGTVSDDCIVIVEYSQALCKPTIDPVNKIAVRHSGKRLNVLRMDGSVESVLLSDVLSSGNSTFTPSVWQP